MFQSAGFGQIEASFGKVPRSDSFQWPDFAAQPPLKADAAVHLQNQATDTTVWSGRYDFQRRDRLTVQEQMAKDVVTDIQVALTEGEHARLWAETTANWNAWLMFQIGHYKEHLSTREGKLEARRQS